ncbi:MAG: 2-succinyl-5-enolpyruvyl-6-hydroxy-3-cyclohexene-1-carboxylic-acid synthase [Bacteroidota bacterium]
MPQYPKNELAQLVLQHCVANKIENVVISPGSRNAPLTIGFVNHPKIKTFSIVDERSAAFFALGIAQQSSKPVAIVCTSGSALLNYYPAIAEAFYSKIPLVVISTDRPKHLIDIGDGQTIRQENVFDNHILFNANLFEQKTNQFANEVFKKNKTLIKTALKKAVDFKGPIHINVPFDEPLYETVNDFTIEIQEKVALADKKSDSLLDEIPLAVDDLQKFADIWNNSSKKMVLLGSNKPDKMIQTQLSHIIKDPSVLVFTETISNVHDDKFINCIDKLISPLNEDEFKDLQPDILITFGGMIVSKKIKQFLRKYKPKHHWHIDKFNAPDTFLCLDHHFKISPQLFFSQFFFLTKNKDCDYQKKWLQIKGERQVKHQNFLSKVNFVDLKVFEIVLQSLPNNIHLQLSNSSVVRYSQLFDLNDTLQVYCNRGTSGIDGSTSTAVGAAYSNKSQTVFITGDISFFYDSNALWNKYIKSDFRIILINNSGGGIFRFIPGPKETNALDYFETPHELNASKLSEMFDFEYISANNEKDLKNCLRSFYKNSEKPKVLEIFTPNHINDKVLTEYFSCL